jgi:hypothetical protein
MTAKRKAPRASIADVLDSLRFLRTCRAGLQAADLASLRTAMELAEEVAGMVEEELTRLERRTARQRWLWLCEGYEVHSHSGAIRKAPIKARKLPSNVVELRPRVS